MPAPKGGGGMGWWWELMGDSAFPPARFLVGLCHQYWATEDVLPEIRDVPILFLSGLKDEIVP